MATGRSREHAHHVSPHLVDFLQRPWTAGDLTNANIARKALGTRTARFMASYDLLLTPTLAVPPIPVHMQGPEKVEGRIVHPVQRLCFTLPINMTGQPAAAVPAGFTSGELPVGLHSVGRHLDDPLVLRASRAFEQASPWADKLPPQVAELGLRAWPGRRQASASPRGRRPASASRCPTTARLPSSTTGGRAAVRGGCRDLEALARSGCRSTSSPFVKMARMQGGVCGMVSDSRTFTAALD